MPFAYTEPLISIRFLSTPISTSLLQGNFITTSKVKDYADVTTGLGLTAYVILTRLSILTLIKLNTR